MLPETANPSEKALYAALQRGLPGDARWWFQARLPGRQGQLSFRCDFLLLDERGLLIIEVKGWHSSAITAADESRVTFRKGVSNQHPLLQAVRYRATLLQFLRAASAPPVHIRAAAALPFISARDLQRAPWSDAFPRPQILLREDLLADLPAKLAAIPVAPPSLLAPAEIATISRLFTSTTTPPPTPDSQPRLF